MTNIDSLEKTLSQHFVRPQKSERWAMYRLINPIIDFANQTLGLEAYFEFNQTSDHGGSQSVDIALLDGEKPVVLVEAKRADRKISAEQIGKYLTEGTRGIVSNGYHWILCSQGESKVLSAWNDATSTCIRAALIEIIEFIQLGKSDDTKWSPSNEYVSPSVTPYKPSKMTTAKRKCNPITVAKSVEESFTLIREHTNTTALERAFLDHLILSIQQSLTIIPSSCRIEFRDSRVSFFNEELSGQSKRVGRIELGKKQPDILVLTRLVNANADISEVATPQPADKGPHMRRFRLGEIEQARQFGTTLGKHLFATL